MSELPNVNGIYHTALVGFEVLFFSFVQQLMEFYERVSGARLHAAYYRPGGVALVSICSLY